MSTSKKKKDTANNKKTLKKHGWTVNFEENKTSWESALVNGEINADEDGRISGVINDVKFIAIGNITNVYYHKIDESLNAVSHHIKFRNGGECRLTFKKTGEVIEFTVKKIGIKVTLDRILIVDPPGQ